MTGPRVKQNNPEQDVAEIGTLPMPTTKTPFRKVFTLLFVFIVIEAAPRIGSLLADHFQPRLRFLDPDQVFSWGIIHHFTQLLIVLLIMIAWPEKPLREWGFRAGDSQRGLRWVGWFTLIWIGIYTVLTLVNIVQNNQIAAYYDVTHPRNLLGELAFRGLLVGISEETVFRAFPIMLLVTCWSAEIELFRIRSFRVKISQAGILAVVFFVYAHIGYNYYPFEITYFNPVQLFTAAGLGILYAVIFEDTRSIYYPALIHSISDVVPVLSLALISLANS
jgi:membrane protease YdiL (CAAX protease family)